ncbi:MAG: hypothetical protein ACYC7D_12120 [Nitrososphaerales archaeon]
MTSKKRRKVIRVDYRERFQYRDKFAKISRLIDWESFGPILEPLFKNSGEVRDREKTFRGLKTEETPILKGYQIFHNYIRPHEGLNGKTPAEASGIKIEGQNKWITLIQNASMSLCNREKTSKCVQIR